MATPLPDCELLHHLAYHVFLPLDHVLPHSELEADADQQVNSQIAGSVISAIEAYKEHNTNNATHWGCIARMLDVSYIPSKRRFKKTNC